MHVAGARAEDGWVVISLEHRVGSDEVDPDACTMTVRAGTTGEGPAFGADARRRALDVLVAWRSTTS